MFLLSQAARALDAAHRRGLVHRDVKPANLLIERGTDEGDPEHVYLTDFGITKHQDGVSGLTSAGALLGTIDYIAPEQVRGMSVLGMADQYSLGCVLYECLTGRLPYEKDFGTAIMWAHVEEPPIPATTARPGLPPAIDDVFSKVLAKLPGERYDSCRSFMNDAGHALGLAEPMSASGSIGMMPGSGAVPYTPELAGGGYLPSELTHDRYESRGDPTSSWPVSQPVAAAADDGGPDRGADGSRTTARPAPQAQPRRRLAGGRPGAAAGRRGRGGGDARLDPRAQQHPGGRRRGHANGGRVDGARLGDGAARPPSPFPRSRGRYTVGQNPNYIAVAPNGKFAYITDPGAGAITVLDTATNKCPAPSSPPGAARVRLVLAGQPDRLRQRLREPLGAPRRVRRHRHRHRDGHRAGGQPLSRAPRR